MSLSNLISHPRGLFADCAHEASKLPLVSWGPGLPVVAPKIPPVALLPARSLSSSALFALRHPPIQTRPDSLVYPSTISHQPNLSTNRPIRYCIIFCLNFPLSSVFSRLARALLSSYHSLGLTILASPHTSFFLCTCPFLLRWCCRGYHASGPCVAHASHSLLYHLFVVPCRSVDLFIAHIRRSWIANLRPFDSRRIVPPHTQHHSSTVRPSRVSFEWYPTLLILVLL